MSDIQRRKLDEELSAIVANHQPELDKDCIAQCGYLDNHESDATNVREFVTKERSESVFAFMYKVFGADVF